MGMTRILGTMLASRMAGRGMRGGGFGGGLGGLAAAGLLGGRRGGLGRKTGLAALGYMAYRAYQDHQARSGGGSGRPAAGSGGGFAERSGSDGGLGGALGGIVRSVSDALSGSQEAQATRAPSEPTFTPETERAAEAFSEDRALLLVRAMVAAANADGRVSAEERARILSQADAAGADAADRRALERELDNPRPLDQLLRQGRDQETAEEFYLASRVALGDPTEANRAYLARLRERLGLAEEETAEIDTLAS
jgi:uncharacterized membrane protein YebE (DUF533 family)